MNFRFLKYKLTRPLRYFKIEWCDWCGMLCFKPTETEYEKVCRHCTEDASACECCKELVHPDVSKGVPWGVYCQDCYDDIYR